MNQVNHGKPMSRQRKWQIAMEAKGLCRICGKPAVNKWYCHKHHERQKAISNKHQKALHQKRRAAGLCIRCQSPTGGSYFCEVHSIESRLYQQNRRLKAHLNPTEPVK